MVVHVDCITHSFEFSKLARTAMIAATFWMKMTLDERLVVISVKSSEMEIQS